MDGPERDACDAALSAKLSLEISNLVARAVRGEPIDLPGEGARLAASYEGLGMTGEMIGSAITRAIGMVGAIRSRAERTEPAPDAPVGTAAALNISAAPADAFRFRRAGGTGR